jgi:putative methyltransferase (TIGR04325 family)
MQRVTLRNFIAGKVRALCPVFNGNVHRYSLISSSKLGYESQELVNQIITKTQSFRNIIEADGILDFNSTRTLLGLALSVKSASFNVLDFGGGAGYHYFIAKAAFPSWKPEWNIVETDALATAAKKNIIADSLQWYSGIDCLLREKSNFDLVFTSSAIQYCEKPLETLAALLDLRSPFVYITRTVLTKEQKEFSINQVSQISKNGPGFSNSKANERLVEYRITLIPIKKFEEYIMVNYDIILNLTEEPVSHLAKYNQAISKTYFCKLKTES